MRRTVHQDIEWISEPYDFGDGLVHVSVFLLKNDGESILVDTGSHYHEEAIVEEIQNASNNGSLEGVIVSHADLPHAGNVGSLEDTLGGFDVICATAAPELVGVSVDIGCNPGERLTVAGRLISFIDAPLADITDTVWAFDHDTGTLFTADGFGNHHQDSETEYTSEDLSGNVSSERIYEYHRQMFRWLEFVDPERLIDDVDEIFSTYDVDCIAPTHGTPIIGADIEPYLERFNTTVREIIMSYE
ncbi:oxygen-binding di-iron domain-containing protein [Halorarum salinum]|uniref:MBL fold metallo-hydrolase n=1 Tax=Halorarum salinum TaxID=2743089 RepID=A0A7D5Q9U9_9EURY|nr:MBL fold metallo-hydrolase [Halobaculum salinum]QLG61917.1 MBL fold metallo-hydrolase [Halobaculum salinum]